MFEEIPQESFFLILFTIEYYSHFCNGYLKVQNLFSVQFISKKYTNDDNNSHITAIMQ